LVPAGIFTKLGVSLDLVSGDAPFFVSKNRDNATHFGLFWTLGAQGYPYLLIGDATLTSGIALDAMRPASPVLYQRKSRKCDHFGAVSDLQRVWSSPIFARRIRDNAAIEWLINRAVSDPLGLEPPFFVSKNRDNATQTCQNASLNGAVLDCCGLEPPFFCQSILDHASLPLGRLWTLVV
jgi:hypothetical protein